MRWASREKVPLAVLFRSPSPFYVAELCPVLVEAAPKGGHAKKNYYTDEDFDEAF